MRSLKYLIVWPVANIRATRWTSGASMLGVALAVFLVTSLIGFVGGYERGVSRDVDRMGFDMLVTARGCPYEAATLMLRGGVGMRYMPDGVTQRLENEPEIEAIFPTLMHPVRSIDSSGGMILFKGVGSELFEAQGLSMFDGEWFGETPSELDVVLGFEAAEYEQRRVGDSYLVPESSSNEAMQLTVVGILDRTGTQLDGTVLMPLVQVQERFNLVGKITGVGVRVRAEHRGSLEELRGRYDNMAELQVIRLSTVVEALREAMDKMRGVVSLMAWMLAMMASVLLVNSTMLRTLSEHKRLYLLHAIGFSSGFLVVALVVETFLIVLSGAIVGLVSTKVLGSWTTAALASYLPYTPSGNLVDLSAPLVVSVLVVSVVLSALATWPSVVRLRYFSDVNSLRSE
jgi:putative ABC transport system permease protein